MDLTTRELREMDLRVAELLGWRGIQAYWHGEDDFCMGHPDAEWEADGETWQVPRYTTTWDGMRAVLAWLAEQPGVGRIRLDWLPSRRHWFVDLEVAGSPGGLFEWHESAPLAVARIAFRFTELPAKEEMTT